MTDTIQEALKNVYCSLGGDRATVQDMDDINSILNEIAKLDIGGAVATKELPTVTDDDAGKVLTVSAEGKWEAADLPT